MRHWACAKPRLLGVASGTVVVLPVTGGEYAIERGRLLNADFAVRALVADDGPPETEAARICAAISGLRPEEPLSFVAFGRAAVLLPSIALAQRAARRRVVEYVLVDPVLPPVSDGWPDAHVSVFSDADTRQPRLRGWSIASLGALSEWQPSSD